jgi:hypothetical protein
MAFTRFHDDPCRIKKQLQESTDIGRWILNVPGQGSKPDYMNDPHIRLQKWGGNLRTNVVNIDSDLKGLTRELTRDCIEKNDYHINQVSNRTVSYPENNTSTEQSRAIMPAWTARDLEQTQWGILPLDPQENVCFPFEQNLNTRLTQKDNFIAKTPCVGVTPNQPLYSQYFSGPKKHNNKSCLGTNNCGKGV